MKVFVAGATGAIGRPLVSALAAARHEVVGMTSSERGLRVLQKYGADGVVVNAFDSGAVNAAIGRVRPDAVIEELTSLPRDYTPEAMRAAEERDRKVRLEGGQNVYHAARTAGARRYLVQSTGFFYGPGARLASETDLLAGNASPGVSGSVRTYLQIEKRVLGSRRKLPCVTDSFMGPEPITILIPAACGCTASAAFHRTAGSSVGAGRHLLCDTAARGTK